MVFHMLEFYTLVDITETRIYRNNKLEGAAQIDWDKRRNQERNWQTVLQLLGFRSQPLDIESPMCLKNQNFKDYQFGINFSKYENLSVWKGSCHFSSLVRLESIKSDFDNIPIITGLNESVKFENSLFHTTGDNVNIILISKP